MAVIFDRSVWEKRAWRRFKSALQRGVPDREATDGWTTDVRAIEGIARAVEWCDGRKINVQFSKKEGGTYDHTTRTISIAGRCKPQLQLHYLLHECGHALIGERTTTGRFSKGYSQLAVHPGAERLNEHRLDVLEEEFEAWHRGWRLGLRIGSLSEDDRDTYNMTRNRLVSTYVKWAARVKGW